MRKASLNLPSQRKAIALYKAPVVKECYKRVISHFNKPKNSYTQGQRLEPIQSPHNAANNLPQSPPQPLQQTDNDKVKQFLAISATPPEHN